MGLDNKNKLTKTALGHFPAQKAEDAYYNGEIELDYNDMVDTDFNDETEETINNYELGGMPKYYEVK